MAGCSDAIISKIENGKQRTSIAIVEGLAVALGVSPSYLAFGHEGLLPFAQKRPVPDELPVDPMPAPTSGGLRERHKGLPARLRKQREACGFTLRGLAALAGLSDPDGLSAQAVLYIEEGRTVPKAETCELLAAALRVSPGWLAYGEEGGE